MTFSPRTRLTAAGILSLPCLCAGLAAPAWAADPDVAAAGATAEATASLPAASAATDGRRFEGTLGLIGGWQPQYPGSRHQVFGVSPGFFLRWGRLTATNAGDFANRRADDVTAGLGLDLNPNAQWQTRLSLRLDGGRSERTAPEFAGLGDIRRTVRARAVVTWRPSETWRVNLAWNPDLLNHGGGNYADTGLDWDHRLAPSLVLTLSAGASWGDREHMQAYFGITPAQAQRTAYPMYAAGAGWRDATAQAKLRWEASKDWILIGSLGARRMLGPAAQSPLTQARDGWIVIAGVGRRF
jgi:outer membrane scaffolding protein for murein synthesis (MipA/OmpV family)